MAKDYDHKKYGSIEKGRSSEQLSAWKKDFGSKSKALHKKMGKKEPFSHVSHETNERMLKAALKGHKKSYEHKGEDKLVSYKERPSKYEM